jgi:hypothetical protein
MEEFSEGISSRGLKKKSDFGRLAPQTKKGGLFVIAVLPTVQL